MSRAVKLIGLDCGTTTTSVVVATARLTTGAVARSELSDLEEVFRSETVFTPFVADQIDAERLAGQLDAWLAAAAKVPGEIFGGGALITGLAAQRSNAGTVARLIESRLQESIVATADDPCLESWLAFMGNCHELSLARPQTPILNIDIGGGTTNFALGMNGQVSATGSLYVGARHFQFVPGGYQLTGLSRYAAALLDHLQIQRRVGDTLQSAEVARIVDFYVALIECTIEGRADGVAMPIGPLLEQVPLQLPPDTQPKLAVTLSGGVGQLVYRQLREGPPQQITQFGDLGGELAAAIVRSESIARRMQGLLPESLGRATVYGLLRHSTELSGSTLYLPNPARLPLKNVPILGRLDASSSAEQLSQMVGLAKRSPGAGCLRVDLAQEDVDSLRHLADRLTDELQRQSFPAEQTLVLLVAANLGKVLGSYVTRWGKLPIDLIVVDEVPDRDAQFVQLGRPREGIVPLWLYAVR